MDGAAVPKTELNELAKWINLPSADYIKMVTDWAHQFAVKGAIQKHKRSEYKDKALAWSIMDRCLAQKRKRKYPSPHLCWQMVEIFTSQWSILPACQWSVNTPQKCFAQLAMPMFVVGAFLTTPLYVALCGPWTGFLASSFLVRASYLAQAVGKVRWQKSCRKKWQEVKILLTFVQTGGQGVAAPTLWPWWRLTWLGGYTLHLLLRTTAQRPNVPGGGDGSRTPRPPSLRGGTPIANLNAVVFPYIPVFRIQEAGHSAFGAIPWEIWGGRGATPTQWVAWPGGATLEAGHACAARGKGTHFRVHFAHTYDFWKGILLLFYFMEEGRVVLLTSI